MVACAQAGARFAVKIFVEENQIAPKRIFLKERDIAVYRTAAITPEKNMRQAARKLGCSIPQRLLLA